MNDLKPFIAKAADGESLSRDEARAAFDVMMSGNATPSQIGGFLMALRVRGETVDEIAGAVAVMREKMTPVDAPDGVIDIVGTGGDNSGSYNVSTCAAFIAAGAGATIAKHGNRSLSSKSGSAEALAELGFDLDATPETISRCIREGGLGFMFAPMHHAAMRHVGPSRVELGTRTIFNLLGPLSNPAGAKRQVVGVFSPEWVVPLAHVLKALGSEHVWVVYGDGLDELTTAGMTQVAELKDGAITTFELTPEDVGLPRVDISDLKGGDPVSNAAALREVLDGARNAYRDIACLNAAAGLIVAGIAGDLSEGLQLAAESLESGSAKAVAEKAAAMSRGESV
ncbi:anthranilate phosphoribosyltransferase [Oricola thermophila]|uniref:Anthranilate phosphoribosyltransferase n=1 Tax=Oricola thermophila TaxID=2742145 RepID=A0A6N1VBQ6_9HYPH|nr:anthranilate phosphoribosyltransferase [Oricola thermophila]QKV18118.1 anthranilate phosphoribosyltransferase [Oricola thermophila]